MSNKHSFIVKWELWMTAHSRISFTPLAIQDGNWVWYGYTALKRAASINDKGSGKSSPVGDKSGQLSRKESK